jgi:urea transport system permease protein
LLGTVLSAALLGQINGLFAILSNDIVARAIVFGVVIALILIRPNGLFNFKSR